MKRSRLLKNVILAACCSLPGWVSAAPELDLDFLGEKFGGWESKRGAAAQYTVSGSEYRTWKPHVTPTVEGGFFVSVRIDHLRGLLASNDHASLELTFGKDGEILSARSTIALQGRKITSDVVKGASSVIGTASTADRMMKVGSDLVADLAAKLLREKVSEPGRVGFPAALQHNYHVLCLAVRAPKQDAEVPPLSAEVQAEPVGETEERSTAETEEPNTDGNERVAPPLQIDVQGKGAPPPSVPIPVPPGQP